MSNALSGNSARTAYRGTNAKQPPNMTFHPRRRTQNDRHNVQVGDFWLYSDPAGGNYQELYFLSSLEGNANSAGQIAKWVEIAGSAGDVTTLTTEDTTVVSPTGGTILILGDGVNTHTTGSNIPGTVHAVLNDSILLPATSADASQGVIALGTNLTSDRFLHRFGDVSNVFVGHGSGNFTNTGENLTAVGDTSLFSVANATACVAIGAQALSSTLDSSNCVAVGTFALSNAEGNNLIAIGSNAGIEYFAENDN